MKFDELMPILIDREYTKIVVSGCKRSGTRISTACIAHDLGFRLLEEDLFHAKNDKVFQNLIIQNDRFAVQCPGLVYLIHRITEWPKTEKLAVIFVTRNVHKIQASFDRLGWDRRQHKALEYSYKQTEAREFKGMFDEVDPLYIRNLKIWEKHQSIVLGDRAFTLEYESLQGHALWKDDNLRKNWTARRIR